MAIFSGIRFSAKRWMRPGGAGRRSISLDSSPTGACTRSTRTWPPFSRWRGSGGGSRWWSTRSSTAASGSDEAGVTDEFSEPVVIHRDGKAVGPISPGDSVIFFNFRSDRARQLTRALTQDDFDRFPRPERLGLAFACMTSYDETFHLPTAFGAQTMDHILADIFAERGIRNLRMAETEKYAHVTYFFNGGAEKLFPGEARILVPSPSVPTYDLQPEMSAHEVAERAVAEVGSGRHDMLILNFANGDMVGHTGILSAALRGVGAGDEGLR